MAWFMLLCVVCAGVRLWMGDVEWAIFFVLLAILLKLFSMDRRDKQSD